MLVAVRLVAEEDGPSVVAEEPDAVVRRLPRPEIDDGEAGVAELQCLLIRDRAVGEDALARPLLAEHRAQDLLLERVVAPDDGVDADGRDHRDIIRADELHDPAVVVGVRVGDEHGEEWLSERLEQPPQGATRRRR
jgi:hypothetical protein